MLASMFSNTDVKAGAGNFLYGCLTGLQPIQSVQLLILGKVNTNLVKSRVQHENRRLGKLSLLTYPQESLVYAIDV